MSNPLHCDRASIKNGKTKAGTQKYKCKVCGKSFTVESKAKSLPKILDRPMTAKERKRKSRGKSNWRDFG